MIRKLSIKVFEKNREPSSRQRKRKSSGREASKSAKGRQRRALGSKQDLKQQIYKSERIGMKILVLADFVALEGKESKIDIFGKKRTGFRYSRKRSHSRSSRSSHQTNQLARATKESEVDVQPKRKFRKAIRRGQGHSNGPTKSTKGAKNSGRRKSSKGAESHKNEQYGQKKVKKVQKVLFYPKLNYFGRMEWRIIMRQTLVKREEGC